MGIFGCQHQLDSPYPTPERKLLRTRKTSGTHRQPKKKKKRVAGLERLEMSMCSRYRVGLECRARKHKTTCHFTLRSYHQFSVRNRILANSISHRRRWAHGVLTVNFKAFRPVRPVVLGTGLFDSKRANHPPVAHASFSGSQLAVGPLFESCKLMFRVQ